MIAELQSAIANAPNRKERLRSLTRIEAVKIRVERAALLLRGAPVAIGASLLIAIFATLVAWSTVDRGILLSWAGAMLALSLIRFAFWAHFRSRSPSGRNLLNFSRLHITAMALNGAMWGALAPILAFHGVLDNGFLPFIVAGMSSATLVSAGASWRAVLAFNIPALAPLAAVFAMANGGTGLAIAGVISLYGFATAYLAWATQRMIDRSILLRTKNDRLLSALRKQVDTSHDAELRFRALVESSQDLTIIFSPEGRVTYASPSVKRCLGGELGSFIGQTTKNVVHPDDMPVFRAVGEKSLSKLGEVLNMPHVCMRNGDGPYVQLGGRLTNMLYVPGVEGFVFNGGLLSEGAGSEPIDLRAHQNSPLSEAVG